MKRKIITSPVKIKKYFGKPIKVRMKGYEGNQYQQYYDNKEKKWIFTHRKVAQKKYGELPKGFEIHHIDKNRENNRSDNLIILHKKDHKRLHLKKTLEIKEI
jgi:hypothetical protein